MFAIYFSLCNVWSWVHDAQMLTSNDCSLARSLSPNEPLRLSPLPPPRGSIPLVWPENLFHKNLNSFSRFEGAYCFRMSATLLVADSVWKAIESTRSGPFSVFNFCFLHFFCLFLLCEFWWRLHWSSEWSATINVRQHLLLRAFLSIIPYMWTGFQDFAIFFVIYLFIFVLVQPSFLVW